MAISNTRPKILESAVGITNTRTCRFMYVDDLAHSKLVLLIFDLVSHNYLNHIFSHLDMIMSWLGWFVDLINFDCRLMTRNSPCQSTCILGSNGMKRELTLRYQSWCEVHEALVLVAFRTENRTSLFCHLISGSSTKLGFLISLFTI